MLPNRLPDGKKVHINAAFQLNKLNYFFWIGKSKSPTELHLIDELFGVGNINIYQICVASLPKCDLKTDEDRLGR